ncbi:trichohyalin-like [Tripterygium wilfordii]|uniref:Trichohyalin-like n=1 Tax=Tripterygium wilfordii TaxID=458696 RepID=A0A7J7CM24_TRIWF|nr:trichohyalin-like [Tripterygium wilfordii]
MSRCVPFPPPGHTRSDSGDFAFFLESSTEKKRGLKRLEMKKESKKRKIFGDSEDLAQVVTGLEDIVNPKSMMKVVSLYKDLIDELVSQTSDDQQDWFLGCERIGGCTSQEVVVAESLQWPRARYLPEVDLFALPYTVPF